MRFDACTAKQLQSGEHFPIPGSPGLRLEATQTARTWTYRYKSPLDNRMKQVKIGSWPAMSVAAATAAWERLRAERDAGRCPSTERRAKRAETQAATVMVPQAKAATVKQICEWYAAGHLDVSRASKGAREVRRMFDTMLGGFADQVAETVTRSQAFSLIESFLHIPVQAGKLRAELVGAWDFALDAGRLPPDTPNW
jgi:hypothetical protein